MSLNKLREFRVFQSSGYFSFDFMNQAGHIVRQSGMIEFAAKVMSGEVQQNDPTAIPLERIPLEKGEPLRFELASFLESVRHAREPKVGATLGKSALEIAIAVTDQIRKSRS
jgi:hypothetical protein